MLICVCWDSGIGLNSVVKLLGGRGAFDSWCQDRWHRGGSCCLRLLGVGSDSGLVLGRQAAWRPRGIRVGVALLVASWVVRTMNFYERDPRCKLGVVGICRVRVVGTVVIALFRGFVKLSGGWRVQSGWCRHTGWRHFRQLL